MAGQIRVTGAEEFSEGRPHVPGTGAAGGLGFAFLTFTNAVLESGIRIVLEETRLEDYVKEADLVITGEGRLDGQTAMGKLLWVWRSLQRNTENLSLPLPGVLQRMPGPAMRRG